MIKWLIKKHRGASHVPLEVKIACWGLLAEGYMLVIIVVAAVIKVALA